jgi:glutamine synthetase
MGAQGEIPVFDVRPLVRRLGKPPEDWQRDDLVRYCVDNGIRIINFRYPALDGKLKEMRLPIRDRDYLVRVLAAGERVDGSSLFPGLFDTGQSDLYVVPVYRWAFLNPWAEDELDVVCRFADREGAPCDRTTENILFAAAERVRRHGGLSLEALAELEFYLILEREDDRFTGKAQRNYHQSAPYLHGRAIADEILRIVSEVTGSVKYCHSEVGYIDRLISDEPELSGRRVEQYELEFDLMPIEDLGCWLTVARWLVRVVADRHGASVTYLPKLDEGMAGSGLHVHLALKRDGRNLMCREDGELSDEALRLIGGLLGRAAPMTAFGNTVAASYLRLVPGQEAPTRVCWGRLNRSSLIRVPLNFVTEHRMDRSMNPNEEGAYPESLGRPTVEYRSPDGSAFPILLLAAVALCVDEGLENEKALALARALEVHGNIFSPDVAKAHDALEQLPQTAVAAAASLRANRSFFEERGLPARLVDIVIRKLEEENDERLSARLRALPAAERLTENRRLMHKDLHKH